MGLRQLGLQSWVLFQIIIHLQIVTSNVIYKHVYSQREVFKPCQVKTESVVRSFEKLIDRSMESSQANRSQVRKVEY